MSPLKSINYYVSTYVNGNTLATEATRTTDSVDVILTIAGNVT